MITPTSQLRITVTHDIGIDVLSLAGQMDLTTVPGLRDVVFSPTNCVQPVLLIDLDQLDFLDSQGIAALVATRRRVTARGGELVLACSGLHLRKLLRICGLDTVVRVVDSASRFLHDEGVA